MKKYDILTVGGVGADTIVKVSEIPVKFTDTKMVSPIYDYVAHTGNGVFLGSQIH
jgi:acarbose 7IV-phosphotransferase